jgi:AcrR family transcriptional regulator
MTVRVSKAPPKRPSSLRESHGEATRERLLQAAFASVERGDEPTMRGVADEAGVGERTVYRYFENHDALVAAMQPRLQERGGVPLCAEAAGLEGYARDLFGVFERNHALIVAMVTARWMAPHFRRSRRSNLDAMRALLDAAYPKAPADDRAAAATTLRAVLSGSGWVYLRDSCAMAPADIVAHAQWLVRTVTAKLARAR